MGPCRLHHVFILWGCAPLDAGLVRMQVEVMGIAGSNSLPPSPPPPTDGWINILKGVYAHCQSLLCIVSIVNTGLRCRLCTILLLELHYTNCNLHHYDKQCNWDYVRTAEWPRCYYMPFCHVLTLVDALLLSLGCSVAADLYSN